jgi:hypothetical protein
MSARVPPPRGIPSGSARWVLRPSAPWVAIVVASFVIAGAGWARAEDPESLNVPVLNPPKEKKPKKPAEPSKESPPSSKKKISTAWLSGPGDMADLDLDPERTIALLADPILSRDSKRKLALDIVRNGKAMLPSLIHHRADRRMFDPGDEELGEPPASVGEICARLAYAIILPEDARGEPHLEIEDWAAWWRVRRDRSIEEMRAELRPMLERAKREGRVLRVAAETGQASRQ